jgi:hypothetical protein
LLLFIYLLCFVQVGFILQSAANFFIVKNILTISIGELSAVMEKKKLFFAGKPESTCLLLLQFCHSILIQSQVFIISFYSQHSFMTPGWFQLRRNFLFTATAATEMEDVLRISQCQKFQYFPLNLNYL